MLQTVLCVQSLRSLFFSLAFMRTPILAQAALAAAKTDKTAMAKAAKKAEAILREMVGITLNTSLTRIQRTNLETCITVHMHQKEISGTVLSLLCA